VHRVPRIVAAALVGTLVALILVALAAGSENRAAARVTLQVAPRGLGSVKVDPAGLDEGNQPLAECKKVEGSQSCALTYDRGQVVKLTAVGASGRSLSAWSTPDCAGASPCNITLDDDLTSVVAVFNPLRLAVKQAHSDAGHVTTDPVGKACSQKPDAGSGDCFEFAPNTTVKVTAVPSDPTHKFKAWSPGCEPTTAPTCTITVTDEPTWVGVMFDNDDPPPLPSSIRVQFKLKLGGNGKGRVTGTNLDCGTVCSAQYDYGKTLTLSVAGDGGSIFDGWNGVCSKAQTSCTVPVGPITSIRAIFVRDATPPSAPQGLAAGDATRTSIAVKWSASSDNVGVTGYRVYLNDAAAGDPQGTEYTFPGLVCGRSYGIAVDAVDAVGNRSPKSATTASTKPCKLAARIAGVGVVRAGGSRRLLVKLRSNRATSARLTLKAQTGAAASGRFRVVPGTNTLRLKVPRAWRGGRCRLKVVLVNPDGGSLVLPGRGVLVPRGR
jgi:chitodextrinase